MSVLLQPSATVTEAWLSSLEYVHGTPGGKAIHVVTTITKPGSEVPGIRQVLDEFVAKANSDPEKAYSVETVAETIFPRSLYLDPGHRWSAGGSATHDAELEAAASGLYDDYAGILDLLTTANGNSRGTYFGRMVSWPGKEAGGVNQLKARIRKLRDERTSPRRTNNMQSIAVSGDAEISSDVVDGLQVYSAGETRTRAFPCLTHVELSLFEGHLHAVAVYRHQYLLEKAYGNAMGLSWLLEFLAQQSGFEMGELVIHATCADTQRSDFSKRKTDRLIEAVRTAMLEIEVPEPTLVGK
jgi:thymidylate synthase